MIYPPTVHKENKLIVNTCSYWYKIVKKGNSGA